MNFLRTLRVQRRPGTTHQAILSAGQRHIHCALGWSGTTVFKCEGDGGTPAHIIMKPVCGFYRSDRVQRPQSALGFDAIKASDGWCDAPHNANYNMPVQIPFTHSHEKMMRDDRLYDIGLVLDWNMPHMGRKRFGGSAIFLHLCKPGYAPTEGCIAVEAPDMRWLLAHIDQHTQIIVMR